MNKLELRHLDLFLTQNEEKIHYETGTDNYCPEVLF